MKDQWLIGPHDKDVWVIRRGDMPIKFDCACIRNTGMIQVGCVFDVPCSVQLGNYKESLTTAISTKGLKVTNVIGIGAYADGNPAGEYNIGENRENGFFSIRMLDGQFYPIPEGWEVKINLGPSMDHGEICTDDLEQTATLVRSAPAQASVKKPTHAKPQLYAYYFMQLKEIAKEMGYNLVIHGSMARDLDLIAIPWVDNPKPELDLIDALYFELTEMKAHRDHWRDIYMFKELPGGRHSYVLNLNRRQSKRNGEYQDDPQYYIDISVTQRVEAPAVEKQEDQEHEIYQRVLQACDNAFSNERPTSEAIEFMNWLKSKYTLIRKV